MTNTQFYTERLSGEEYAVLDDNAVSDLEPVIIGCEVNIEYNSEENTLEVRATYPNGEELKQLYSEDVLSSSVDIPDILDRLSGEENPKDIQAELEKA